MADETRRSNARVTAETYGAVQVCDEDCWLLRIPPTLAAAFAAAPEGTVLGDLVFTKGGHDSHTNKMMKPSFTVHVSEEIAEAAAAAKNAETPVTHASAPATVSATVSASASASTTPLDTKAAFKQQANLPLQYSLEGLTKNIPVIHPFVRHETNGSIQIWGTVSRTANAQVQRDDTRYRAQLKDRLVEGIVKSNRFVKAMENTESVTRRAPSSLAAASSTIASSSATRKRPQTFGEAVFQSGKRRLEAMEQNSAANAANVAEAALKKGRRFGPEEPLRSVFFELFADQPFWAFKDLKAAAVAGGATHAASRKADTEIRTILNEIGKYHRSGDHKNMWELREEYRQRK